MKSKLAAAALILIMILTVIAGCTVDAEEHEPAKEADVQVYDAGQIEDELGIKVKLPADAENEIYNITEDDMALMEFTIDGARYEYCLKEAEKGEEILILDMDFANNDSLIFEKAVYTIKYNEGKEGVTSWYNDEKELACYLYIKEGARADQLTKLTENLIEIQ